MLLSIGSPMSLSVRQNTPFTHVLHDNMDAGNLNGGTVQYHLPSPSERSSDAEVLTHALVYSAHFRIGRPIRSDRCKDSQKMVIAIHAKKYPRLCGSAIRETPSSRELILLEITAQNVSAVRPWNGRTHLELHRREKKKYVQDVDSTEEK